MVEYEFVDELPKGPRWYSRDDDPAIEACHANPGRWLMFRETENRSRADSLASTIRKGERGAFRDTGPWEAAVRTTGNAARVYIRYVGDPVQ